MQVPQFNLEEKVNPSILKDHFSSSRSDSSSEMHKLRILKLKDFITLQNKLSVYDYLEEERMKSFNTTFKQMETNQFHKQYRIL